MKITCPHCQTQLECDDSFAGSTADCPTCGKPLVIQASPPPLRATAAPKFRVVPPQGARHNANGPAPGAGPAIQEKSPKPRSKKKRIIGIVLLVVGLLFLLSMCSGEQSVDDFRADLVREANRELANPNSQLRKRIELAHATVTVQSAYVLSCDVSTLDGSNRAGNDGDNIRACSLLLRFEWQGLLESGYTDLRIDIDAVNRRTSSGIEDTTAAVNLEDTSFWFDVGAEIGGLIAEMME